MRLLPGQYASYGASSTAADEAALASILYELGAFTSGRWRCSRRASSRDIRRSREPAGTTPLSSGPWVARTTR
jgi:hypothetical protein